MRNLQPKNEDGELHGYCTTYYNDVLTSCGHYVNGVEHGRWDWWHRNGDIDGVEFHDMGVLVGYYTV